MKSRINSKSTLEIAVNVTRFSLLSLRHPETWTEIYICRCNLSTDNKENLRDLIAVTWPISSLWINHCLEEKCCQFEYTDGYEIIVSLLEDHFYSTMGYSSLKIKFTYRQHLSEWSIFGYIIKFWLLKLIRTFHQKRWLGRTQMQVNSQNTYSNRKVKISCHIGPLFSHKNWQIFAHYGNQSRGC